MPQKYLRKSDSKVCNVIEDRYVGKVWNLMQYIVLCAQKNGPCGQSGQRPADSPISPLFYQAKRTYPDLTFPIFEHHTLSPSMYYYICTTYQACLQALKPYGHESSSTYFPCPAHLFNFRSAHQNKSNPKIKVIFTRNPVFCNKTPLVLLIILLIYLFKMIHHII